VKQLRRVSLRGCLGPGVLIMAILIMAIAERDSRLRGIAGIDNHLRLPSRLNKI
jgi:hypothetical protein